MGRADAAGLGLVTLLATATCVALPANRPEAVLPLYAITVVWAGLERYSLRLLAFRAVLLSAFLLAALIPSMWFDRSPATVFGMQTTLGTARVVAGVMKFGVTTSLLLLLHRSVPFPRLLGLLSFLPSPLLGQLTMLYRFLDCAQRRMQELSLAVKLRGFAAASLKRRAGIVAAQAFSLVAEGFARGEAAATYMTLRGFSGRMPLVSGVRWGLADTVVALPVFALAVYAMSLGWGWL